jgi:hypothetical protein
VARAARSKRQRQVVHPRILDGLEVNHGTGPHGLEGGHRLWPTCVGRNDNRRLQGTGRPSATKSRFRCPADRGCHRRGGPKQDADGRTSEVCALPADRYITVWARLMSSSIQRPPNRQVLTAPSGNPAAPTHRPIRAPQLKILRCHHPPGWRQSAFAGNPTLGHAALCFGRSRVVLF